jgi:hypothetical protein
MFAAIGLPFRILITKSFVPANVPIGAVTAASSSDDIAVETVSAPLTDDAFLASSLFMPAYSFP